MRSITSVVWLAFCGSVAGTMACYHVSNLESNGGTDTDTDTNKDSDADSDTEPHDTESDDAECFDGDYTIADESDVMVLDPYSCITGSLTVTETDLTSVDLPNLVWVGGELYIGSNDALTSLDGLSSITSVGSLDIYRNIALTSLGGLSNIASAVERLSVEYNDALVSLDLNAITAVDWDLDIEVNPMLTSLDLSGLTAVGGHLSIGLNYDLASLDGLGNVTSVGGHLYIQVVDALTSLDGLGNITSVGGDLFVDDNIELPQCEACDLLDQLVEFSGSFDFHNNLADTCTDTCD